MLSELWTSLFHPHMQVTLFRCNGALFGIFNPWVVIFEPIYQSGDVGTRLVSFFYSSDLSSESASITHFQMSNYALCDTKVRQFRTTHFAIKSAQSALIPHFKCGMEVRNVPEQYPTTEPQSPRT